MEGQHIKPHGAKKKRKRCRKGEAGLRKEELNEQLLLGDDVHNQPIQIRANIYYFCPVSVDFFRVLNVSLCFEESC